ncbi:MAG: YbhB/YbcL family Raf kinase inhibitor-like protein [Nitrospira sp.]|uniref:YbhB/YbcL family Raf kinase inhibitor-like protein n=1 Tax=Nitrospira defluvii TaxID=330214 RepID=A0ABN7LMH8_9BACT|nr:YbhB/YbcL family Raf kinase inhibitor-like protein [Nitrospira defluvii]MCS6329700.1 YbhB/YbcL family Raf kinase inhibitor-like protein [Nitrospira sp.]CAE6759126.1 YbhB/YbcL family Raf kinase inhibitor-like protein [Nitrospira defluvii]
MAFELTGSTFKDGELIPKHHTCEGEDLSPPLRWNNPPPGTRSFVLIVDDPDAPGGTWVHWVLFNIPIDVRGLAEGLPLQDVLPNDACQGMNDFKRVGYGGPCPPPGKPHRYYFRLYALDHELRLKPRATKAHVVEAMKGHVLAEAQLMGRFGR